MSVALYTKDLRKTYPGKPPVEAVRGLDLEVPAGITFGLLGPNGAGKTTTVEILEGLLEPTAGQVEVLGMTWARDAAVLRERIGVSLQETQLAEKLTVAETVELFGSFYKRPRDPGELIELVGLQEKRDAWVVNLSGGQKQRLAVATALVGDPELLFLDEPTTGLDPQSRRQLWDVIRELRSRGRTILLTTHYMDEAERLSDLVAVVDHGKVIALGSPAELIATLGGEHVIEFAVENDAGAANAAGLAGNGDAGLPLEPLRGLPSVIGVRTEAGSVQLTVGEPHLAIPALLDHLERGRRHMTRLTTRHASLEDVFVNLTGRHLRDG
jgi:ABC-2 type transport system ATP-binding protein